MRLASKMWALVNDKKALKVSGREAVGFQNSKAHITNTNNATHDKQAFLSDGSSAGNWVPTRFLAGYMTHAPAVEPEAFDACPILLTQPAQDRWTPLPLR